MTTHTKSITLPHSSYEVYATPLPQLAKISDLFTGQGHHFQSAIASHLFSPVSIYQTRIPGFEVSAPIPSKLAYTENVSYQPQAERYTAQTFKPPQKPANLIRVTYPQPVEQYQRIQQLQQVQPQQVQQINQYQQLQAPQIQPVLQYQQQQPQFIQIQPYQPSHLVYNQQPFAYQGPAQFSPQPFAYAQQQLPGNIQPGIVYAREENNNEKPIQRELKTAQPQRVQQNVQEKPVQNYNTQNGQSQGAVSYASFSVGLPASLPQTQNQYESQPQAVQYQTQPQIQYQSEQQYQIQPQQGQVRQQEYQLQAQQSQKRQPIQNQVQYQIQRQPLPQFSQRVQVVQPQQQQIHQQIQQQIAQKSEPAPANSVNIPSKPVSLTSGKEQLTYYRTDPVFQPQVYQGQGLVAPQQILAVPTYPPVQFFGKFAQELFRNYQQQ